MFCVRRSACLVSASVSWLEVSTDFVHWFALHLSAGAVGFIRCLLESVLAILKGLSTLGERFLIQHKTLYH